MNKDKFKLVLSAPLDKNGMVIKLTVRAEGSDALHLDHYPEFTWYTVGVFGLFGAVFISLLLAEPVILIYCAAFLVFILYHVFSERAFTCTINKKTGAIDYHRSGVLMTPVNEQKSEHNVSEIKRLEMHRYVKGGGGWNWSDTFQVFILFNKGERIAVSPHNLSFSECQGFTEQIRSFLGNEIPVKAID
ncbi:MAG: hypothetical protein HY865_08310 [Chloroflexi bacterium]|nr:hypothetical protein [Chloroflexota bacterium]